MLMWTDGEFDEDCGVLSSKRPSPIGGWLSPRFAISPPPMNEDNNSALSVRRRLGDPDRMELKTLDAQTKDTDLFVEKGLDLGTFSTNPAGVEVKVAKKKEASDLPPEEAVVVVKSVAAAAVVGSSSMSPWGVASVIATPRS